MQRRIMQRRTARTRRSLLAVLVGLASVASSPLASAAGDVPSWFDEELLVVVGDFTPGGTASCWGEAFIRVSETYSCDPGFKRTRGSFFAEPVTPGSGVGVAPKVTGVVETVSYGTQNINRRGVSQSRSCQATVTGSPAPTVRYRWIQFNSYNTFVASQYVVGHGPTITLQPGGSTDPLISQGDPRNSFVYCEAAAENSAGRDVGRAASVSDSRPEVAPTVVGSNRVGDTLSCLPSVFFGYQPSDSRPSIRWIRLAAGQTYNPLVSQQERADYGVDWVNQGPGYSGATVPPVVYQGPPVPYVIQPADVGFTIRCTDFGTLAGSSPLLVRESGLSNAVVPVAAVPPTTVPSTTTPPTTTPPTTTPPSTVPSTTVPVTGCSGLGFPSDWIVQLWGAGSFRSGSPSDCPDQFNASVPSAFGGSYVFVSAAPAGPVTLSGELWVRSGSVNVYSERGGVLSSTPRRVAASGGWQPFSVSTTASSASAALLFQALESDTTFSYRGVRLTSTGTPPTTAPPTTAPPTTAPPTTAPPTTAGSVTSFV
jgi:hypothetical protein